MATEDIIIRGRAEMDEIDKALAITGQSLNQFNKQLNKNFMQINKNRQVVDKFTNNLVDVGQAAKKAAIMGRRFKMEWLSIMFAGMALDRAFGGLIRTQMQLFGVTDMMSSAWTIVLLPIMELLTPILYKLIDAFMNLSPGMKLAVGAGILFLAVAGKIMLVVGQIFLGIMGFKLLFPVAFKAMAGGAGAFLAALAPIVLVIGVIIALATAIYLAWKTNFMNIRSNIKAFAESVKNVFRGFIQMIKGVLNIIKGIFTGDFELIKKGIVQTFKGLAMLLLNIFRVLGNGIVIIFKGVVKLIWNVFKVVVDAILWAADKAHKFFGGKGIKFRMPKFQTGGLVTQTGPAILHRGERVIPKNRVNREGITFSPTVVMTASINNDMDVRILAENLNRYWSRDFERLLKGRGSY